MTNANETIFISSDEDEVPIREPPRMVHRDPIPHRRPEMRIQRQIRINQEYLQTLNLYANENNRRMTATRIRLQQLGRELRNVSRLEVSAREQRARTHHRVDDSGPILRLPIHSPSGQSEALQVIRGGERVFLSQSGSIQRFSNSNSSFSTLQRQENGDMCSVCLEDSNEILTKGTTLQITECAHELCQFCILNLVKTWNQDSSLRCPCCRTVLLFCS